MRTRSIIQPAETAYIGLLLKDPDPASKKSGLQKLCYYYRQGFRLADPNHTVTTLLGLLHDEDAKVRRWSLNALALLGTKQNARAIADAVGRNTHDPDVFNAGITALAVLLNKTELIGLLEKYGLPYDISVLLASAQHNSSYFSDLRKTRIDIDLAPASDLRLSTILIGLDKAPENLFAINHDNKAVIGALNTHPDPAVAQYSVWAAHENRKLGLAALRLPLRDASGQPDNVRGWIYQLGVRERSDAERNIELIEMVMSDPSPIARSGLATGLLKIYFNQLPDLVLRWYDQEENDTVKQRLLEHMTRNADYAAGYAPPVLTAYRNARENGLVRARIDAAARDTQINLDLRKIALGAHARDLFNTEGTQSKQPMSPPRPMRAISDKSSAGDIVENKDPKVLIVTALPKEAAAVLSTMNSYERAPGSASDPGVYEEGIFIDTLGHNRRVLVAQSGMGTNNASTVGANCVRTFPSIRYILMVGIAGGCPDPNHAQEHVRLGDVVVSSEAGIIEYDFVKRTEDGDITRAHPQKPDASLLGVHSSLAARALLGQRPWEGHIDLAQSKTKLFYRPTSEDRLFDGDKCVEHPADKRRNGYPLIHQGGIASSDILLKKASTRDLLRDRYRVKAVEMEASGLQNAAWAQGRSIFVVRGICDYCDSHKDDAWQEYAALAAAAYARVIIEAMPLEWF